MQYTKILLLGILYGISSWKTFAQETALSQGTVTNVAGESLPGVLIKIQPLDQATLSDERGNFRINGIASQNDSLIFSFLGFKTQQQDLILSKAGASLAIVLKEATQDLEAVTVTGKSENRLIREKAYNVNVVDAKKLHHTSLD